MKLKVKTSNNKLNINIQRNWDKAIKNEVKMIRRTLINHMDLGKTGK